MFHSPIFGGCKYTNNFLFINKNPVFQHFELLITQPLASGDGSLVSHVCPQPTVTQVFRRFCVQR